MIAPLARRPRAARFVARPHRFAALVRLRGGAVVEAHLPNPSRLTGTLSENCRVWVEGPFPPPRMLPYSEGGRREAGGGRPVTLARGSRSVSRRRTARGARHARSLAALARAGKRTAIVFVAQRDDIQSVSPAAGIDPDFAAALAAAAAAGVVLLACALEMTPRGAVCARRVPVSRRAISSP